MRVIIISYKVTTMCFLRSTSNRRAVCTRWNV